jgi:hypothetical protein
MISALFFRNPVAFHHVLKELFLSLIKQPTTENKLEKFFVCEFILP